MDRGSPAAREALSTDYTVPWCGPEVDSPSAAGSVHAAKALTGQDTEGKRLLRIINTEVVRWEKSTQDEWSLIEMMIQLVRKPPVGKKFDSLRVVLEGNHTLDEKLCEFRQALAFLQEHHNIANAGASNLYMPLVDQWGHPLTRFPDGTEIVDHILTVKSPYSCAADFYRAG